MRPVAVVEVFFTAVLISAPAFSQEVALSQQIEIRMGVDRPEPVLVPLLSRSLSLYFDVDRPSEAHYYSVDVRVLHDPVFIAPLSSTYATEDEEGRPTGGRTGIAGWTSPTTPVGPPVTGYREVPGSIAFGFAITWGGPPPPPEPDPGKPIAEPRLRVTTR